MKEVKVLMVSDSEDDYTLVSEYLQKSLYYNFSISLPKTKKLEEGFDIYLISCSLSRLSGIDLLRQSIREGFEETVIILAESENELIENQVNELEICNYINKKEMTPTSLERTLRFSYLSKERERKLKLLVKEKDIMLQEMNHRVKNNLNYLHSLLSIHAARIEDEKSRIIFKEGIGKIFSISNLYNHLTYDNENKDINVYGFFKDIISDLKDIFNDENSNVQILYRIQTELCIHNQIAILLGLIFNELFTNSVKYAFKKNNIYNNEITLECYIENKFFVFSYNDNGIGISSDSNINDSRSHGLQFIKTIVKRLNAELLFDFSKGVQWTIKIPDYSSK